MSSRSWRVCLAVPIAAIVATAHADSWRPPETRSYVSPDGNWRLTVKPRDITSPLAYFRDKVAERPNAGGVVGDTQASAVGHMEHLDKGHWRMVWTQPLGNEVSPVDAMASNAGQAVTFDNWHSMGYGNNAVAIYDAKGKLVRAVGLTDFLPKEYVHALPRSVSSIHWRGEPQFSEDGRQVIVPVVVPSAGQMGLADEADTVHVDVRFDLADGQPIRDTSAAWSDALASAREAAREIKQQEAAARKRFIEPLAAPVTGDVADWHAYLSEAFFRIDPDWEEGYPSTKVIPLRGAGNFERISGYLGDAMTDEMNAAGAIMVASPYQEVLVEVLEAQAKRVKPGALSGARVYVATDARHVQQAWDALAHTGAQFLQIDIDETIPQRKVRLERYLGNLDEAGDPIDHDIP